MNSIVGVDAMTSVDSLVALKDEMEWNIFSLTTLH